MLRINLIPLEEFRRIEKASLDKPKKLGLLADMCRANALAAIKKAGSGHVGSSFSSLDIVTFLYCSEMNTVKTGFDQPNRDIYLSSKGHDAPSLYAVLFSLGIIPKEKFMALRRLGGLSGHPDIRIPGIEANTGSLGMGISKAKGLALAKRLKGSEGRVLVMTGDGELQEGQIYEALQSAAHQKLANLYVIVDHNKVQSDHLVEETLPLGNLEAKFESFGWHVARCNGHDFKDIERAFRNLEKVTDKPKALIADTIKGRGVSFMEHPYALALEKERYRWHAGAPDDKSFEKAYDEIVKRVNDCLKTFGLRPLALESVSVESALPSHTSTETITQAYGRTLIELAALRRDLIVLDADLAIDCCIRDFQKRFPNQFVETGIAEQDMVSTAGGLARQGFLPVVNSFASFLASRANEQIYNNASENTRIIYAAHYAGLIPAQAGLSHQSIRDISLLGALPNMTILQPCNPIETQMIIDYCVREAKENCVIRLVIGPSPWLVELPPDYHLTFGRGVALTQGSDAVLFAYGPTMLCEALQAAKILQEQNFFLKVVNMPWLNRIDTGWLEEMIGHYSTIFVLEDHAPIGGLGDFLLNKMSSIETLKTKRFEKFAVDDFPVCGSRQEALQYHGLDGKTLGRRILKAVAQQTQSSRAI